MSLVSLLIFCLASEKTSIVELASNRIKHDVIYFSTRPAALRKQFLRSGAGSQNQCLPVIDKVDKLGDEADLGYWSWDPHFSFAWAVSASMILRIV